MTHNLHRQQLAREAKSIVALALRNGPIEDLHAGKACPTCTGQSEYSKISSKEMKLIITNAVDRVYWLLCLKNEKPAEYESQIHIGEEYTAKWDEPDIPQKQFS